MDFASGTQINHFRILEKIGQGGMGVVYKAQDTRLERFLALKFLPPADLSSSEARERFVQEAKAASALNHPNITTIYEIGEHNGQLYIAMELIEGKILKNLIQNETISLDRIIDFSIQACDALNAAHQKGIVHRDIKSDNLMLTGRGQIKIMDFGLAKLKGDSKLTRTGSTVGTVADMSPEQARGLAVDHRRDIFSLGVVLFELIAGRLPFTGEHQAALIYSITTEEPQPLSRYRNDVSQSLQGIVSKALAKDRQERYQSVNDMEADLRRCKKEISQPEGAAPGREKKSVAVLYFENLSSDPESNYFAAGMTEDIITDLSKIENIRVASRNSVLPFKDKPVDIPALGRKLNVDSVLEGSVRKAGSRLRITAQLIDTKEGFHLWAERYDRELKEIFDLQEEIAKNIAQALRVHLSEKEEEKIAHKYKGDLKAYEYYLKGRTHYYQYTKSDLKVAVEMFNKALEIDPNYALAYAGLADAHYQFIDKAYESDSSFLTKAEEFARKALELDPQCAEAYKALGTIHFRLNKTNTSSRLLRKALEINPNHHPARANLGLIYFSMGEFEKAERELLYVYEMDPGMPFTSFLLALHYLQTNNYDSAEKFAYRVLELGESTFYLSIGNYLLAAVWLSRNDPQKAMQFLVKAKGIEKTPFVMGLTALVHAVRGERAESLKILQEEFFSDKTVHEWLFDVLVIIYHVLGEDEKALEWLEKGFREQKSEWPVIQNSPFLAEFRKNKRVQELIQKSKQRILNSE